MPADITIPGFVPGTLEFHTVSALQRFRICGGGQSFDEAVTGLLDYSSNNTTVATVAPGGGVTVRAPGQATIEGEFEIEREICNLVTCEPVIVGVITLVAASIILAEEPAPFITSISPDRGLIGAETTAQINGSNLGSGPAVLLGGSGVMATIISVSAARITVKLSVSSNAGLGNHSIQVRTGGGTSNSKNFFVQEPTTLRIKSVGVLPTRNSPPRGCVPGADFGIKIDLRYEVLDQGGRKILSSEMRPQEKVLNTSVVFADGVPRPVTGVPDWMDIGPKPGFPTSSQQTNSNGEFSDVPLGSCASAIHRFSFDQVISVLVNSTRYSVRSHAVEVTASQAAKGRIKNNIPNDLDVSR